MLIGYVRGCVDRGGVWSVVSTMHVFHGEEQTLSRLERGHHAHEHVPEKGCRHGMGAGRG